MNILLFVFVAYLVYFSCRQYLIYTLTDEEKIEVNKLFSSITKDPLNIFFK